MILPGRSLLLKCHIFPVQCKCSFIHAYENEGFPALLFTEIASAQRQHVKMSVTEIHA